ncbi:Uncharacterised protein [Cedecea neteri]|uniref:Uncharacterized protein n=1 Tax=Cedecea neteri TaxID=158822 RepID=A0A2X2TCG2_9ENTR|nr:Uncharacterised protein [Cedecea neteri]
MAIVNRKGCRHPLVGVAGTGFYSAIKKSGYRGAAAVSFYYRSGLTLPLLEAVDKPRLVLSWETIITVVFWGYTAWLPGHESLKMAAHAVAMLGVVALYLWGYPALMRLCRQHPGRLERVESYFWLISLVILFSPFYKLFHHLYYLDNKASSGLTRVLMVAAILLVPLGFTLWGKT